MEGDHQGRAAGCAAAFGRRSFRRLRAKPRTPARRHRAARDWGQRDAQPRTSPNNRPARCARSRDTPCRLRSSAMNTSGRPAFQRALQRGFELLKAAQRDARHQLVTVAKMPVRRRGTDPRPPRRLGKGKAGRPLLRDQFQSGADERLLEIAVVIAARAFLLVLRPAHVNSLYMSPDHPVDLRKAHLANFASGRDVSRSAFIATRSGFGIGLARPPEMKATRTLASTRSSSPRITC